MNSIPKQGEFTIDFPTGKRGEVKGVFPAATEIAAGEVQVTQVQVEALRTVISQMQESRIRMARVNGSEYGLGFLTRLVEVSEKQLGEHSAANDAL